MTQVAISDQLQVILVVKGFDQKMLVLVVDDGWQQVLVAQGHALLRENYANHA
ncbi:hypothetical protein RXV91_06075 [Lactiplantibacillus sp. DA1]|uniref:hypothetical protein n=1 Tax=Lactiplantibacillus sp. DA1 TaxID=3079857 RepID=UPI00292A6137|nr:hypothetical protein [Lactiplantibacillus sp. DA1]MDV0430441.1 hypothetical protein [Lactiplantibacillus sp. DA1]